MITRKIYIITPKIFTVYNDEKVKLILVELFKKNNNNLK